MTLDTNTLLAYRRILKQVLRQCPNDYAQGYASYGLGLVEADAIHMQLLYIRENMKGWRGQDAEVCKALIDELTPKVAREIAKDEMEAK